MSKRRAIPYGTAVVLDRDRDYTYLAHADDEVEVLRLAAGITCKGIAAAIARPVRVQKMNRLIGIEINMVDDTEIGFAENPRALTTRELAENLAQVTPVDENLLCN
jgi:hypothetical protein